MSFAKESIYPAIQGNFIPAENAKENLYLEALLNSAKGLAIIAVDLEGFVLFASNSVQRLFGRTAAEIVGCDLLALFSDADLQRYLMWQIRKRGILHSRRSCLVSPDRPTRQIEVMMQCVMSAQAEPFGFICLINDLTRSMVKKGPYYLYQL
jgi:PAS domain S-box-containing protein